MHNKRIESNGAFAWLSTRGQMEQLSDADLETFIQMLRRDAADLQARISNMEHYVPPLDTVDTKQDGSPELQMLAQVLDDLHGQMADAETLLRARGKAPLGEHEQDWVKEIRGHE